VTASATGRSGNNRRRVIGVGQAGHGFHGVAIEEARHDIVFPTVSAFHEWSWSTGWRRAWQAVPDAHLDEAKAAIDAYLESSASGHGSIRLTTGVRYTRATAAA
jgi:hypothetical protein